MKKPGEVTALVREAFAGSTGEFRPCIVFDERLDCIRVVVRDCSVTETRINELITILEDNYYPASGGNRRYVGFTVKGARHFCQSQGLNIATPVKLSAIFDKILAVSPEPVVQMAIDGIARPLMEDQKLEERVDLSTPVLQGT